MNNNVISILVLAGIAIFLILKLRSVLGSREGFEKPPLPPSANPGRRAQLEVIEGGVDHDIADHVPEGSDSARALAAMKKVEPSFTVSGFLSGARAAYEMILMAFERGTLEEVRPFMSPEVYEVLEEVVAARNARGLTVTAEFLGIREVTLLRAEFDPRTRDAELTVRFTAELISAARNAAGEVIEGDPKKPRRQRDVWTFARKMGSPDPNWLLVATGE